eukprot:ANDGO_02876.mRNA.1 Osmotic avoidance abnormal protein 3
MSSEVPSARVRVAIRLRPSSEAEAARGDPEVFYAPTMTTLATTGTAPSPKSYTFDLVLPGDTQQEDVIHACSLPDLLSSVVDGYISTVMAYGPTGAGKTFTMTGPEQNPGMIPRAFSILWDIISHISSQGAEAAFRVQCSYLEIYNEKVYDLLTSGSSNETLPVRWTSKEGFFVEGLMLVECRDASDMMFVLREGLSNRRVAANQVNRDSSRSHALFTVFVECKRTDRLDGTTTVRRGKMHFVDLAGSERLGDAHMTTASGASSSAGQPFSSFSNTSLLQTQVSSMSAGSSESTLLRETVHINKSLFTLGKVISVLGDPSFVPGSRYVPYRESVLTRLLMDALGGSGRTLLVACASPSLRSWDETMLTLQYAARAANIRNRPMLQMDPREHMIEMLREQLRALHNENQALRSLVHPSALSMLPNQMAVLAQSSSGGSSVTSAGSAPSGSGSGGVAGARLVPLRSSFSPQNILSSSPLSSPLSSSNGGGAVNVNVDNLVEENNKIAGQLEAMQRQMEELMRENDVIRAGCSYIPEGSSVSVREEELARHVQVLRALLEERFSSLDAERLSGAVAQLLNEMRTSSFSSNIETLEVQKLKEHNASMKRQIEELEKREKEWMRKQDEQQKWTVPDDLSPDSSTPSSSSSVSAATSAVDAKRRMRLLQNENGYLKRRIFELEAQIGMHDPDG